MERTSPSTVSQLASCEAVVADVARAESPAEGTEGLIRGAGGKGQGAEDDVESAGHIDEEDCGREAPLFGQTQEASNGVGGLL
eukprot:15244044-Alexandrium_andersonii.AAC.1